MIDYRHVSDMGLRFYNLVASARRQNQTACIIGSPDSC